MSTESWLSTGLRCLGQVGRMSLAGALQLWAGQRSRGHPSIL